MYMRKLFFLLFVVAAANTQAQFSMDKLNKQLDGQIKSRSTTTPSTSKTTTGNKSSSFTENEAGQAIKQVLLNGITAGVTKASSTDGFFKNAFIKVLFPPEAKVMESTLRQVGAGALVDNIVLSMNRAAEQAAPQAKNIFVNSITQLTITDAINIVSNQQTDAATKFLERTTTTQLVGAFKPAIKTALDKTLATRYWQQAMTQYNRVPFVAKINTDLPDYVTRKGISGLFYLIAQEEAKIRKDPAARTTDILQKVFGGIKL